MPAGSIPLKTNQAASWKARACCIFKSPHTGIIFLESIPARSPYEKGNLEVRVDEQPRPEIALKSVMNSC